jgi:hypothetical protein
LDDPVNNLSDRQPGEPRSMSGIGAGARLRLEESRQPSQRLDPGFHREPWIPAFARMTHSMEFRLFTNSPRVNQKNILKP